MGGATLNHENLNDHEIFIPKIYFNANLERFTKFSNHETGSIWYFDHVTALSVPQNFHMHGVHMHCVDM